MIIDEVVWQVINRHHCSFKIKTDTQTFCRNEYNVNGLCSRSSCPLANSQYATIQHEKGLCYLVIKTPERAHTPANLWQKIQLDKNYLKAIQQIEQQLEFWPNFLIHKCKQRLTKLRQMLIRIRKLKLQGYKEVVPIKKKAVRREKQREIKSLVAADIEGNIEKELLDRLKEGIYPKDIYNFNLNAFEKAIGQQEIQTEEENEIADEEDLNSIDFIYIPNESDGENNDDNLSDNISYDSQFTQQQKDQEENKNFDEKSIQNEKSQIKFGYQQKSNKQIKNKKTKKKVYEKEKEYEISLIQKTKQLDF